MAPSEDCKIQNGLYRDVPLPTTTNSMGVLDISPGNLDREEIDVTLRVMSLDSSAEYEALSYTWANQRKVEVCE